MVKTSWFYYFLRLLIYPIHYFYYKKIVLTFAEKPNRNEPIIFVANHQNALMDALAIIYGQPLQSVFLTRADIFKRRAIKYFLTKMLMLPVYRIRDGADSLKNNDVIFQTCVDILKAKRRLGLFPEGMHNHRRTILPLKKAVPRIAFLAEESSNWTLDLKIIPVGIYYDDYFNARSVLQLNFGKPLLVNSYKDLFKENEGKAMIALRDDMFNAIKPLTIDIQNSDYYEMYDGVRFIYNSKMRNQLTLTRNTQKNIMKAAQKIIAKLDTKFETSKEQFDVLQSQVASYNKLLSKLKLVDSIFEKENYSWLNIGFNYLLLVLFFPVFVYGYVNNFAVLRVPNIFNKKIKDRQFHSSVRFGLSLFCFPVFYFLQTIIVACCVNSWWIKYVYFVSLPISVIYYDVYKKWNKSVNQKRLYNLKMSDNDLKTAIQLRKLIIQNVDNLFL